MATNPEEPKPLLTRKKLAKFLDCSLRSIDNLQIQGLPCVMVGKSPRFIEAEVIAWMKSRKI